MRGSAGRVLRKLGVHACVHTYVHACVCVCVCLCMHMCEHLSVSVHECTGLPAPLLLK